MPFLPCSVFVAPSSTLQCSVEQQERFPARIKSLMNRLSRIAPSLLMGLFTALSCQSFQESGEEVAAAQEQEAQPQAPQIPASPTTPPADPNQDMVRIPGGSFLFGATERQFQAYLSFSRMSFPGMKEQLRSRFVIPPRPVSVRDFRMDSFEVTNQQFLEFLQATGYQPGQAGGFLHHWETARRYPEWAAGFPVVWVSAADAQAYCQWRGGRLPSEQEWERAARGDDGRFFPWGNQAPSRHETAVFSSDLSEPVGSRAGDASPFEVYDLGGNVSEWTSDSEAVKGKQHQVARGGNYRETAREMFTFNRRLEPLIRNEYTGFRCVLEVPER